MTDIFLETSSILFANETFLDIETRQKGKK